MVPLIIFGMIGYWENIEGVRFFMSFINLGSFIKFLTPRDNRLFFFFKKKILLYFKKIINKAVIEKLK